VHVTRIRTTIGARLVQTDFLQTSVVDSSQLHAFAFQDLITLYCMLIKSTNVSTTFLYQAPKIKLNVGNSKPCTKIGFQSILFPFIECFLKEAHYCGSTQTLIFPTKARELNLDLG
jgi:hypothetical protein